MGLDMYAFTTTGTPAQPVDFCAGENAARIHYWRKHPDLHGWMERLYRDKGGEQETFNCVNLQLTAGDLDSLEADVKQKRLPETNGFFFGQSDGAELVDDLLFIAKAREALAAKLTVFYTSWW